MLVQKKTIGRKFELINPHEDYWNSGTILVCMCYYKQTWTCLVKLENNFSRFEKIKEEFDVDVVQEWHTHKLQGIDK